MTKALSAPVSADAYMWQTLRYTLLSLIIISSVGVVALCSQHLATLFIYGTTAWLAFQNRQDTTLLTGLVMSAIHGMLHHLWPFINEIGLAVEISAFWDIFFHFLLCGWAIVIGQQLFVRVSRQTILVNCVALVLILGNMASVFFSFHYPVNDPRFVDASLFSAQGGGYFIAVMLSHGVIKNKSFNNENVLLMNLCIWIPLTTLFYFIIRASHAVMSLMFVARLYESYFIVPLWMLALPKV